MIARRSALVGIWQRSDTNLSILIDTLSVSAAIFAMLVKSEIPNQSDIELKNSTIELTGS